MSVRIATILMMLSLPLPLAAQGSSVPVVAVIPFNTYSLSPGEDVGAMGGAFASMMRSGLADRPEVTVVDGARVEAVRQQLALPDEISEADASRLGKMLEADYIVVGSVTVDPKEARLDLRLVDLRTSEVRAAKRKGSRDDFLVTVTGVADEFTTGLEGRVRVASESQAPPAAVLSFSRGLDYERRGMREQASRMYRQALELFPEHEAARSALQRVAGGGTE